MAAELTLAQLVESVRSLVPSPQNTDTDLKTIIKLAHRTIARQYQWSLRRRETVIQTVAAYSTGTVTTVTGSATITGSGTAWTAGMVGRQITIAGEYQFFYIASVNVGAQTLTLGDAQGTAVVWAPAGGGAKSHRIFKDQFAVPADVAGIMTQVSQWPLVETSLTEIDLIDPLRVSTGTGVPDRWYWCRTTSTGGVGTRFVGLWPVPGTAFTLRLPYLIEPPDLTADSDLPVCPSEVLELAAQMRAAWRVFGITGDQRWALQSKGFQQALYGAPDTPSSAGMMGILQQALQDDEVLRFGLPTRVGGTSSRLGLDEWATHDFEARGF